MRVSNSSQERPDVIAQGHLDPDLLAAFVERNLPADDEERIYTHLAECASCRQWVLVNSDNQCSQTKSSQPFPVNSWRTPASIWLNASGTAALLLLSLFLFRNSGPLKPSLTPLEPDANDVRTIAKAERAAQQQPRPVSAWSKPNHRRPKPLPTRLAGAILPLTPSDPDGSVLASILLKGSLAKPQLPRERFSNDWKTDTLRERWERLSLTTVRMGRVAQPGTLPTAPSSAWAHTRLVALSTLSNLPDEDGPARDNRAISGEKLRFLKYVVLTKNFR